HKNFGPRFGFAYQAHSKAVIRGGDGIMYVPTVGAGYTSTGFTNSTPMVTSVDGGLAPFDTLKNPFPNGGHPPTGSSLGAATGIGTGISGQLRDAHRGYSQQWNFTLQLEPKSNWLVEAAWLGNHGTHLMMFSRPLNILSPANFGLGTQLVRSVPN